MAVASGQSLKKFIESILIAKADSITVEVSENPSPSGDSWFNSSENINSVKQGIRDVEDGKCRAYSMDEIRRMLGV